MGNVALSFDNGPDPAVTPGVLDVLARRGVKATFFVLGKNLASAERMKLAQRAAAEGHRIGNHSFSPIAYRSATIARRTRSTRKSQRPSS